MKKYLAAVAVITVLIPSVAFAKTSLTSSQISAIVGLLQAFGASQSIVNNVEVALGGTTTTTAAPTTFTTPNGAVIDANGNIITPAPLQPAQAQPTASTVSSSQLQNGLAQFYAQWSLSSAESSIPQLLSILSNEQAVANDTAQESALCVSEYNTQVAYFQQQGQTALSNATGASEGFVLPYAMANIKAQTQEQLNDLKDTENSCLASHSASSSSGQISQLTSELNQLQSEIQANPTSLSTIASILQNYNSLYGQVLAINSSMQTQTSVPAAAPSSAFFSCNSQGGQYTCNGAGVSMSCSSVAGGSFDCVSTSGQDLSCTTQGGNLSCSSY